MYYLHLTRLYVTFGILTCHCCCSLVAFTYFQNVCFFYWHSKITCRWFIQHSSPPGSTWTLDITVEQHTDHFTHLPVGMSIYSTAAGLQLSLLHPLFAESMSPFHHLLPIIWTANSASHNSWQCPCCQLVLKVDPNKAMHWAHHIPVFVLSALLFCTSIF